MSVFDKISDTVGLPEDQIRLVSGFLLSVPVGFVFRHIKGRQTRINVGTFFGLLFTLMVYQERLINVVLQTAIVYFMVKKLGKKCAVPVFIETLVYVSIHHIYRQVTDYGGWKMDITTILMMNTCKWTSFAWCVHDGFKEDDQLSEEQKQRRIKKLPSFLEYFGYMFFYCGCLAGPAFDYYEWDEFMDLKGTYAELPTQKEVAIETLRKLRNAVCCATFMILGQVKFPLDYIITEEFGQSNFLYKAIYMQIMITLFRTTYLTGWCFSEASIASSGFTFNGWVQTKLGKIPTFDRIKSVDLWIDTTFSPQEKVRMWNISVQNWLRRYVYVRVYDERELKGNPKKQNQAQMTTYMVSAFWHGFYPGYYLSFVQWGIMNTNAKFIYKAAQNTSVFKFFQKNPVGQFLRFFWINWAFNSFGCGFILLSIDRNLRWFNNMYWTPIILNLLVYGFFATTGFGQRPRKPKQQ